MSPAKRAARMVAVYCEAAAVLNLLPDVDYRARRAIALHVAKVTVDAEAAAPGGTP